MQLLPRFAILVLFLSLLVAPAGANPYPELLFAVDSGCDCLYMIDLVAPGPIGVIGDLGSPGRFDSPSCMAIDLDGTVYVVNAFTEELLTVNRETGAATVVASGVGEQHALAIAPVAVPSPGGGTYPPGTLFGISGRQMVVIDKTGGGVTIIGNTSSLISGLDFHPYTGVLYGAGYGSNMLVQISTETVAETLIGIIGPGVTLIGSITFFSDALYGSDIIEGTIFRINVQNGMISNLIQLDSGAAPEGLGANYFTSTPVEPSTWSGIKKKFK